MKKTTNQTEIGISVIIPTMCSSQRQHSLWRAINSIGQQNGVDIEVIIIVNGKHYDHKLFEKLKSTSELQVHYLPEASLPAAIRYGRSLVTKEYFAFLDDDDEYLPQALTTRVIPLSNDADIDIVVTNGFIFTQHDRLRLSNAQIESAQRDPLLSLLAGNWLSSCGALYRSSSVPIDYFDGKTKYYEWTLLAFRLALDRKNIQFLNEPTFRVYDNHGSISKTKKYREASSGFVRGLLNFEIPAAMRNGLLRKLAKELHGLSNHHLGLHEMKPAWKFHIQSLNYPGGLKYLTYTRKLIYKTAKIFLTKTTQNP